MLQAWQVFNDQDKFNVSLKFLLCFVFFLFFFQVQCTLTCNVDRRRRKRRSRSFNLLLTLTCKQFKWIVLCFYSNVLNSFSRSSLSTINQMSSSHSTYREHWLLSTVVMFFSFSVSLNVFNLSRWMRIIVSLIECLITDASILNFSVRWNDRLTGAGFTGERLSLISAFLTWPTGQQLINSRLPSPYWLWDARVCTLSHLFQLSWWSSYTQTHINTWTHND